MDIGQIMELLSQQAFPIVAYIMMFLYMKEKDKIFSDKLDELRQVIENNTKALTILSERTDDN